MNSFYGYGGVSSSPAYASTVCNSPSTYTSPNSPLTYASPTSPPAYNSYQMTSSVSNPCSFYPTAQQSTSSAICPAQRPMYSTSMSSSPSCSYQTTSMSSAPSCSYQTTSMSSSPSCSYQTTTPISSTTSCQLAQSFINQLHSGLPGEGPSHLIDSICPPDMMQGGQCHVDNAVLFAVLDRI